MDAGIAERAECVMLNKGPFAVDAIRLLDDVLGTMEGHQFKEGIPDAGAAFLVTATHAT